MSFFPLFWSLTRPFTPYPCHYWIPYVSTEHREASAWSDPKSVLDIVSGVHRVIAIAPLCPIAMVLPRCAMGVQNVA
eukprot:3223904-Rhodomonas_salina.5